MVQIVLVGGNLIVYQANGQAYTWRRSNNRSYRQPRPSKIDAQTTKMMESRRSETVLRNLSEELLTDSECRQFKQALHHFRVSNSVTSLCQQLKPVINTTSKILLLVELNNRMPRALQEDFYRLCSLQFPNYETYLKIFTNGNASNDMPRVIAQDSSGKFRIVSQGSEKKMMVKYNNQKQTYELRSQPGTSVTSGVYSNGSDSDNDDVFDEPEPAKETPTPGRITPVHLEGKTNVHKVFMNRHEDGSLGLGITGGKEYGTEIEINVVEDGGPAATQGIQVGDRILEVNGHNFHNITHSEAVMIMRNAWNLIILIERPSPGQPNDQDVADMVTRQHQIQNLELTVFPSASGKLGCVTQRLPSQDLIVTSLEENMAAFKAGLRVHDLIYKVDGISVRELSESQIVMLTHAKRICLSIKRYVPLFTEEATDGTTRIVTAESRARSVPRHHRQQQRRVSTHSTNYRALSSPRSDGERRDHSAESRHSGHHTTHYYVENAKPSRGHSAHVARRTINKKPDHFVYATSKSVKEPNWIISPKTTREYRYTQQKEVYRDSNVHSNSYPFHVRRSQSDDPLQVYVTSGAETYVNGGNRVSRYVRNNRSHSPNKNTISSAHKNTITRVHNEDNVIRAIQVGLEKRQRAIRRSRQQMPDPADYEWEI